MKPRPVVTWENHQDAEGKPIKLHYKNGICHQFDSSGGVIIEFQDRTVQRLLLDAFCFLFPAPAWTYRNPSSMVCLTHLSIFAIFIAGAFIGACLVAFWLIFPLGDWK